MERSIFAEIFLLQHVATKFLGQKEEEKAMVESQQWAPQNQSSRYIREDPNTSIRRVAPAQIFGQHGAAVTHPFSKDLVHWAQVSFLGPFGFEMQLAHLQP